MPNIKITTFRWVPPMVQGLVRDLRVRWALEEVGLPYTERLLALDEQKSAAHRVLQPFGQVPAYEEDDLTLFESGAIVLHIAQKSRALLPTDEKARARALTWMFAALNTVEPPVQYLALMDLFFPNDEWSKLRRPGQIAFVQMRLDELAARLSDRDYVEDEFTAADLLMSTVLRLLRHTKLVADMPALAGYQRRCEARPAFQRALAGQMVNFEKYAPAAA
jgi:glutathione S-transferase